MPIETIRCEKLICLKSSCFQTQLEVVELQKIGSDEELHKSKDILEQAMSKLQSLEHQKLQLISRVKNAKEQSKEWENMMALLRDDRDR